MHDALLIAKREYLELVRSRAFLFTTVLVPLLMGFILHSSAPSSTQETSARHALVIASNDVALARAVKTELENPAGSHYTVDALAPVNENSRDELKQSLDLEQYDGLLWLERDPGQLRPRAVYELSPSADRSSIDLLKYVIARVIAPQQLARQGLPPDKIQQLLQPIEIETHVLENRRASTSDSRFAGAYVMILLLFFSVVYYGISVAHSVIQEKTSRIFEVLLASTRPESLMAGKLIGVGGTGLTQIGIWLSLAFVFGRSPILASLGGTGGWGSFGISPAQVFFFLVFFLLGFLFYSALSAALGASVSSEQEIQQFSFVLLMPMIAGLVLMPYIVDNPNDSLVVALSLFPPFTPMVMFLRIAAQTPPFWQLALSVLLMIGAIWVMLWIASRIYRVGILMYGKRPKPSEILRWLRYS